MKKITLILLPLLILITSCKQKTQYEQLYENFEKQIINTNSVSAKISYWYVNTMFKDDTFKRELELYAVADTSDTIYQAILLQIQQKDTIKYFEFYHKYKGYSGSTAKQDVKYYPNENSKYVGDLYLLEYYLYPNKLKEKLNDTATKTAVYDTIINNKSFKALKLVYKTNMLENDLPVPVIEIFYFDPKTYNLIGKKSQTFILFGWSVREQWLKDIKLNSIDSSKIIAMAKDLMKNKQIIDITEEWEDQDQMPELLPTGSKAPNFAGILFPSKDSINFDTLKAKAYLLDFWFMNCLPCWYGIRTLIKLNNKYKDKGLMIIGINSIDNSDKRWEYIDKFAKNIGINYTLIMTNRAVDRNYKVLGYPTFYLLDSNKTIIFGQLGYDKKAEHKLDSLIQILLK